MGERVSVRPERLADFAKSIAADAKALQGQIDSLRTAFTTFVNSPGGSAASSGNHLVNTQTNNLADELAEIAQFVRLIHKAVIRADKTMVNGVASIDASVLAAAMKAEAAASGVDLADVSSTEPPMTVPLPDVTTVPQDSGYVNDPVCTATGLLVIAAQAFVMPPRLEILSFPRYYASGSMRTGAFGPGWWSWASARLVIDEMTGEAVLHCPDGGEILIPASPEGEDVVLADLRVVDDSASETIVVHWGSRSRYPFQRWEIDRSGRLVAVDGYIVGRNEFSYDEQGRLTSIAHDGGRSIELRWTANRIERIDSSDGRSATFSYSNGVLVATNDAIAPRTFETDALDRITAFFDADGIALERMEYDEEGRVLAQMSATGLVTRFAYASPRRTTVQGPDRRPLSVYQHDERGRVVSYATADGRRLRRRFDERGEVVWQEQPDGRTFECADVEPPDDQSEPIERWTERRWSTGLVEHFGYDHATRLVRVDGGTGTLRFRYEGDGPFPIRIEGPGTQTFDVEWTNGVPSRIVDADQVETQLDIDGDGVVRSAVDATGVATDFDPHVSGEPGLIRYPGGRTISFERDDAGRMVALRDASGAGMRLAYTPAGRLESITDPLGATTDLAYGASGLVTSVTGPDGAVTKWLHDEQQRVVGIGLPDGTQVRVALDLYGNPTSVSVDGAETWTARRDAAGRVVESVDPTGLTSRWSYLPDGSSVFTDSADATWQTMLDLAGRVRSFARPDGTEWTIEYDGDEIQRLAVDGADVEVLERTPAGRVSARTLNGRRTTYRYAPTGLRSGFDQGRGWWSLDRDLDGRVVGLTSPEGRIRRYGYDDSGRLASVEIGGATWSYRYDPAGNLVETVDPLSLTSSFSYDSVGRMISATDPSGATTLYRYDVRGHAVESVDASGATFRSRRDHLGRIVEVTDALDRTTEFDRDAAGRCTNTAFADGTSVENLLDARGLVIGRRETDGSAVRYQRDAAGRIAVPDPGTGTDHRLGRAVIRDADGYVVRLIADGIDREWTRDAAGLPVRIVDRADDDVVEVVYERDAAGRVISSTRNGETTRYMYDDGGRLVGTSSADGEWRWSYDVVGRLVKETTPSATRTYVYDAAHQLSRVESSDDGTTVYEYDARGRRTREAGPWGERRYLWGVRGLESIDDPGDPVTIEHDALGFVSRIGSSMIVWDHNSSPPVPRAIDDRGAIALMPDALAVEDDDGALRWIPVHPDRPWGEWSIDSDGKTALHPFHGVARDGLVWLGARVYDIRTRQFLSPDPAAPVPGMVTSMWPYAYAAADPINLFDPLGTSPISQGDFQEMMDRATGVQWDNVATVAKVVAVVAATAAVAVVAGPAALALAGALGGSVLAYVGAGAAVGAAAGGASAAIQGLIMNGEVDWGDVAKGAAIGAVAGAVTGGIGGFAAAGQGGRVVQAIATPSSAWGDVAKGASQGFVESTASELYDLTPLPASDGSFDKGNIAIATTAGGAGEYIGGRLESALEGPDIKPIDLDDTDLQFKRDPSPPIPIKGNINSRGEMIYHSQHSRYYDVTKAEVEFSSVAEAEAAGFRPPKNMSAAAKP